MSGRAVDPSMAPNLVRSARLVSAVPGREGATDRARTVLPVYGALGNQGLQRALLAGLGIQPQLTVNAPGDAYEQEADRVADTVMRMEDGQTLQRACAECEQEEEKQLHRSPVDHSAKQPALTGEVESRIVGLRGGGAALPSNVRRTVEPRFGRDFGGVRIHTGSNAAEAARAVSARAFTLGSDIVFGGGEFSPNTKGGLRLLAHELTHVVQQGAGETDRA